ncbi:hypothetical protein G9P44_003925 [Scheffersomyces stipitis]|nr:hypothetical protein G9P44_003925 [Scheffersomyces stipitis]
MAIEKHIKEGDIAVGEKDFLGAIGAYSAAIKEDSNALQPYLKRANTYLKLKNYDQAKSDISVAYQIADSRGKREEMGLCYFRLGLIYYAEKKYKLAVTHFDKAIKYNCVESTLQMWKTKAEYDLKKHPEVEEEDDESDIFDVDRAPVESTDAPKVEEAASNKIEEITAGLDEKASTNIAVINKQAPLKIKIRDDWYQSNNDVTITIYAKNVKEDKLQVLFKEKSVAVSFPSSANSEYNYNLDPLYSQIDTDKSRYKVYGTKVEITLVKKASKKWPTLEASGVEVEEVQDATEEAEDNDEVRKAALSYPSSSKKAVNWANFKVNEDEEEDKGENSFFTKLYEDVDDDTRRAMMKSYVQSNGTVLTTNWAEAKDKEFETSPPEGMEAKQWGK